MVMMIMVLLLECLKCPGACNDNNGSITRVPYEMSRCV